MTESLISTGLAQVYTCNFYIIDIYWTIFTNIIRIPDLHPIHTHTFLSQDKMPYLQETYSLNQLVWCELLI